MGDVYHTTNCNWLPANNFLFQIANVLLVLSYFVPDNLNGLFLLRFFLGTAGLFFALWGWMILCAPDTFGWNVLFMIGNYVHALYLFIHIKRPRKFSEQCELVYEKLFEPLGVQRFQFQKLVKICTINDLKHGEYYGRTGFLADRVSILLKGRVDVTNEDHTVHTTKPFEFLDSPEWASSKYDEPTTYDVSLVASDDIQFLSWNRNTLRKLLKKENFLKNVFESVIGQDVTKKLLALTRNVSELRPGATAFKASSILYLHQDIIEAGRPISREIHTDAYVFHHSSIENSSRIKSANASPNHMMRVEDNTPLIHQNTPNMRFQNNGVSLHKAVKLFSLPNQENDRLIQDALDDVIGGRIEPDLQTEKETVL